MELSLAERMAVFPVLATGWTVGLEFIILGLHEVLHLRADIELGVCRWSWRQARSHQGPIVLDECLQIHNTD